MVVGIILLFIGTGIIPSIAHDVEKTSIPTSGGKWWYVGGSGPGNYTTITEVLNFTSDGDTIFVYHGTYYENPAFSKLNLIGEDRNTTIIDGGGKLYVILTEEANIHGFTIQNAIDGIMINGNNLNLSNNIITKCQIGIPLSLATSQFEIWNNVFLNNTVSGIYVESRVCSIHDNYFISNPIGIDGLGGGTVSIVHNQFEENDIGIRALQFRATISRNNFINNDKHVQISSGMTLLSLLFSLPYIFYLKPHWINNYWDDWNRASPRPIRESFDVGIYVLIGIHLVYIKLFSFPMFQFDWHPAQEPYDIPGMC